MKGKLHALQEGILAGNRAVRQMRKRGSTERFALRFRVCLCGFFLWIWDSYFPSLS